MSTTNGNRDVTPASTLSRRLRARDRDDLTGCHRGGGGR